MEARKKLELRSEVVQDIISYVPVWMIRWGTTLIFILVLGALLCTWMIKYPDIVSGRIKITTEQPPIIIVNKINGKILKLTKSENDFVKKGDFIAEIENPTSKESIDRLNNLVIDLEAFLNKKKETVDLSYDSNITFGDIQNEYNSMIKNYHTLENHIHQGFYNQKSDNLQRQIKSHIRLSNIIYKQLNIIEDELKNVKEIYDTDVVLYEKGITSKIDFLKNQNNYKTQQHRLEEMKKSLIQNDITLARYKDQLIELNYTYKNKEKVYTENLTRSIQSIKNFIDSWEKNYVIKALEDGRLTFLENWSVNQHVSTGKKLFTIIPANDNFLGIVEITAQGMGKVKKGQKVNVQLDNYPYAEYGQLDGTVKEISLLDTKDNGMQGYRVKVQLSDGLSTTYHKKLDYQPNMLGMGNIITEDLRLIERVFYKLRKLFH